MMIRLYKGSESVKIHPVDLPVWLNDGWLLTESEIPQIKPVVQPTIKTESTLPNLDLMGWRELKSLAEQHELSKPDDVTWEDFKPTILEAML